MYVCLLVLNLRDLKSYGHKIWHVGPLSDLDVHGPSGILIFKNLRWPAGNIENHLQWNSDNFTSSGPA